MQSSVNLQIALTSPRLRVTRAYAALNVWKMSSLSIRNHAGWSDGLSDRLGGSIDAYPKTGTYPHSNQFCSKLE